MKKLFFCFFIFVSVGGYAQYINDSIVSFIAQWKKDEVIKYSVAHIKFEIDKGDTLVLDDYAFDVKFEILEKREDGSYKVKWTNSNFHTEMDPQSIQSKMNAIEASLSFVYETSELGVFKQILNFDEISASIKNALDVANLEYANNPKAQQSMQQLRNKYASPGTVLSFAINDILHYHWIYGSILETDTTYTTRAKLPNIYGGKPLNADSKINIVSSDPVIQSIIAQTILTVDSDEATESSFNSINRMAAATGRPPMAREDMPKVTIDQRYASNIIVKTGKMIGGVSMRTIKVGEIQTSVEKTQIYLNY